MDSPNDEELKHGSVAIIQVPNAFLEPRVWLSQATRKPEPVVISITGYQVVRRYVSRATGLLTDQPLGPVHRTEPEAEQYAAPIAWEIGREWREKKKASYTKVHERTKEAREKKPRGGKQKADPAAMKAMAAFLRCRTE
jgi:hypothetical protein